MYLETVLKQYLLIHEFLSQRQQYNEDHNLLQSLRIIGKANNNTNKKIKETHTICTQSRCGNNKAQRPLPPLTRVK